MIVNKEVFSWALKIIKYWAKVRGIYGYNFGYLNGISIIIMLVKAMKELQPEEKEAGVLIEPPTAPESRNTSYSMRYGDDHLLEINDKVTELVTHFFKVYSEWDYSNAVYA